MLNFLIIGKAEPARLPPSKTEVYYDPAGSATGGNRYEDMRDSKRSDRRYDTIEGKIITTILNAIAKTSVGTKAILWLSKLVEKLST